MEHPTIRSHAVGVGKHNHTLARVLDNSGLPDNIRKELASRGGYITRNSKCPCGSGQRFKRCCGLGRRIQGGGAPCLR
jgi:uncharacterized protein YecA (UPF0149 family)